MSTRQQRSGLNRRRLQPGSTAQPGIPIIVNYSAAGHTLEFQLEVGDTPSTGSFQPAQVSLNGIPLMYRELTSAYPTAATIADSEDGPVVTLTYGGAVMGAVEVFTLAAYDPAFRTVGGGYVAPSRLVIGS